MTPRSLALGALLAAASLSLHERPSRATPPDAGPDAGPPPPAFDATPIPTERSPRPKPAEWRAATPVSASRNRTPCRTYRVREWMKVDCSHFAPSGIGLVAGPTEGVELIVAPFDEKGITRGYQERATEIIFPLRPGSAHVFQLLGYELDPNVGGPAPGGAKVVVTDQWLAGGAPLVTLY